MATTSEEGVSGPGAAIDFGSMLGFFLRHALRAVWGRLLPIALNVLGWHALILPGVWVLLVFVFPGVAVAINSEWPNAISDNIDKLLAWWQWKGAYIAALFIGMWITGFFASIWDEVRDTRTAIHRLEQRASRSKVILNASVVRFAPRRKYDPRTGTDSAELEGCHITLEELSVLTSDVPITVSVELRIGNGDQAELFRLSRRVRGTPMDRSEDRVSIDANSDQVMWLERYVPGWRGDSWLNAAQNGSQALVIRDCRNPKRMVELMLPNGEAEL